MQEIQQGALELESGTIDLEDVDQAYEEGADNEAMDQEENINDQQQPEQQ
jgi:exonuclease VII small subunit